MPIPFIKAHGARNDFLLTWRHELPAGIGDPAAMAVSICDRHTGAGADGWMLMTNGVNGTHAGIELWNSDGSRSEMSGNGTRCAAAVLVDAGLVESDLRIATGAGVKKLRQVSRTGRVFHFEMNMGAAAIEELHSAIAPGRDSVILNTGNPQCAVLADDFDFDWRTLGKRLEWDPRFPNRTNVSFVHVVDRGTIEVRFFERGAGETMSSGTGSTGAAAAAFARGLVDENVRVLTPAGPLDLRRRDEEWLLTGPAEIVARGEFYPTAKDQ